MPNRDGTGPEGKGPRTGRGLGNCPEGTEENESPKIPRGRGLGPCGLGLGRGRKARNR
jgi:hypothetical protein